MWFCRVRTYVSLCAVRVKRGRCAHNSCCAHSKDIQLVRHHVQFGDDIFIFVSFTSLFRTSSSHCVRVSPPGITIASSNCARQLKCGGTMSGVVPPFDVLSGTENTWIGVRNILCCVYTHVLYYMYTHVLCCVICYLCTCSGMRTVYSTHFSVH